MDQVGFRNLFRRFGVIAAAILLCVALAIAGLYNWRKRNTGSSTTAPQASEDGSDTVVPNPLRLATQKVEEDRGEPTGNKAEVKIPPELKLYSDRRRFLAIQVAEWREQKYEIPKDFYELASMAQKGEFTALPVLSTDYILYGVGLKADAELTHYDEKTNKSLPLFGSETEIEEELGRLKSSLQEFENKVSDLRKDLARLKKGENSLRREALDQIAGAQKAAALAGSRIKLIEASYKNEEQRQQLIGEYQKLSALARDFDGRSFDLKNADERRQFKVQLLSALRPPARAQLEEIAKAYREKFSRPLPLTSLMRTIEYQIHLGEAGNPNAIRIAVPPHTTGLAFDIYTYYMTSAEQQFLLDEIARLEKEGRVEALRENRFHIHVFAFADGSPPSEKLIKESLNMKVTAVDSE